MGDQSLRRDFCSQKKHSNRNEIKCCCILIIYYCWQASSATLPSRARRMTSFVKIFRSVGVERLPLRSLLLLLALFFIFGTFFSMRRRSVWASGGRGVPVEWLFFQKLVYFVRGVSIFAMVSPGTFLERRLIHLVVSIWRKPCQPSCFYVHRVGFSVSDFVYFCYRTGCLAWS